YSSASTPSRATTTLLSTLFFLRARRVRTSSSGLSSTNRMSLSCMGRFPHRSQREVKGRALLDSGFRPDLTAMAVNDALHGGQPDARAREILLAVQALKGPEQFRAVGHLEADAVIADEISQLTVSFTYPEFDARLRMLAGKFPGIAQQIVQHDP